MKRILQYGLVAALAGLSPTRAPGQLTPEQQELLPPPAARKIDFTADIQPILEQSCTKCHAKGKTKGGFNFETRESLLAEADSGPAVLVGDSAASYLIELVAAIDPDNVMPKKGSRLTPEQVGLLRAWIDQGVDWKEGVTFAKPPALNLTPRQPDLPADSSIPHPVDRLLAPYYRQQSWTPPTPVSDRIFARRVHLDVIGLLPSPDEMESFLKDNRPDKRTRLVKTLLTDNRRYAEHWLSFWNDLLRNDYRGTGYIDGGRKQISTWLFSALASNMPYDKFVARLIDPVPESEGFIKGIVWRGVVNASQRPEMQAAQNVSQVFMGVNLKCASCHDSFINDWALADAYALASVFSGENLEMYRCDQPTGQTAGVGFLYPELGEIPASLSKAERQKRLAQIMTGPDNGRLTRTIVNRLWQRFMGRALVEPVDDMEQAAWHQDLLDWLAEDLAAHGYDLKHTMARILTSQAYQLPAVDLPEQADDQYVFQGPSIRRMTAEQFRDAMGTLTQVWFDKPAAQFDFTAAQPEQDAPARLMPARAQWIWTQASAASRADAQRVYWRKSVALTATPETAEAIVACDNSYTLFVNGHKVLQGDDFKKPNYADLSQHLKPGRNLIAIEAVNHTPQNQPPAAGQAPQAEDANPAGLLAYFRVRAGDRVMDFGTDASWTWSLEAPDGWQAKASVAGTWQAGRELGPAESGPWNLGGAWPQALLAGQAHGGDIPVRAALVPSDPLTRALGRPPREQLLTTRNPTATTLQALELTNGDTLTSILQRGAAHWLEQVPEPGPRLVERIFQQSLGRPPNPEERRLTQQLVGEKPARESVEDLLWSIAMLPEFQLIY